MKQFKGYDSARERANVTGSTQLPVGGYVGKIQDVRYEDGADGKSDRIILAFDITEGEFKDFFKKKFEEDQSEDKKWKGRVTIYVPNDDGTERDEWTQNAFAKWTAAFETSNEGYKWDWDEKKWKGLSVGLVYGETGTVIDGKEVVYTECRYPASVSAIRDKKFRTPKFKAKNGYTGNTHATGSEDFMKLPETDATEIPF